MDIEKEIFKKCKFDEKKLVKYGFIKTDSTYKYSKNVLENSFRIDITVDENYDIEGKIFEVALREEYTNFRISDMKGTFVETIKKEFIHVLNDIKKIVRYPTPSYLNSLIE